MSSYQTFALCLDCWEFHYGISDSNGVYIRDSGSSNHFDCAVHVFGAPSSYSSSFEKPIKAVLMDLQRGVPISDGRISVLSLACALNAIQPNNGKQVKGADVPLGAVQLHQSKRGKDDQDESPSVEERADQPLEPELEGALF